MRSHRIPLDVTFHTIETPCCLQQYSLVVCGLCWIKFAVPGFALRARVPELRTVELSHQIRDLLRSFSQTPPRRILTLSVAASPRLPPRDRRTSSRRSSSVTLSSRSWKGSNLRLGIFAARWLSWKMRGTWLSEEKMPLRRSSRSVYCCKHLSASIANPSGTPMALWGEFFLVLRSTGTPYGSLGFLHYPVRPMQCSIYPTR